MSDNSSIPVASGNETFANKDIGGVKFPKNIQYDSSGAEVVPATQTTAAAILAKIIAAPATETSVAATAAVLGTTSGAAVVTSITGTIQGYLRGIVSLLVSGITVATHAVTQSGSWVLSAGSALIGKVDIQVGGVAPAMGDGAKGSTVIRTTLATDSAGIIPLVAHDTADSGEPLKTGGRAVAGMSGLTLVAAADRTDSLHGIDGAQYVRPHCGLEDIVTGNATNTDGTSTSCIASSGAGVKTYLTSVVLCNTSATAITVDIKDGSTTKVSLPLPSGSGCVFNPPVPIPGTAATAWNFDPSAAATTVTCSMVGFKSKV